MITTWFDYSDVMRLEPDRAGDVAEGFQAPIADPVWFLGRQWQMGEHRGEDAATPVRTTLIAHSAPIEPGSGGFNGDVVPFECLVEGEDNDWWTTSRRIRVGRALIELHPELAADALRLDPTTLPAPYDTLDPTDLFDGLALWRAGLADQIGPIGERLVTWDPHRLAYSRRFTVGDGALSVRDHRGGEVDWWSVDATSGPDHHLAAPRTVHRLPTRLSYRGAPHPRWWQIESVVTRREAPDPDVRSNPLSADLGAHAPDRTHLATLLLIELAASHSDDWFVIPLPTEGAEVLSLDAVSVIDAFGRTIDLLPADDWWIFRTSGLTTTQLVVLPSAPVPLEGSPTDRVEFSVDEGANLAWAVERLTAGRMLADTDIDQPVAPGVDQVAPEGGPAVFVYRPSMGLRRRWHPYLLGDIDGGRAWIQASIDPDLLDNERANDLDLSDLITENPSSSDEPVHRVDSDVLFESGVALDRAYRLARTSRGHPVLWRQRSRLPLLEGTSSGLRFDVLETVTPEIEP